MTVKPVLPATFRYVAFLDLLVDAVYQHRLATQSNDSFSVSRHARASVAAAFLTIESLANCLLEAGDMPKKLTEELDFLRPLAKIEVALRARGKLGYDRGRREVQLVAEVISVRNGYVHSKATKIKAEVHPLEDAGRDWRVPFEIYPEFWKSLNIPKQSMLWSTEVSYGILKAVRDYLRYVIVDVLQADEDLIIMMLASYVTFGSQKNGNVIIPNVFDEFIKEIGWIKGQGIDFTFLKMGGDTHAQPQPG